MRCPIQTKIHLARRDLALTDDSYRAILGRVTGKTSTRDMTPAERQAVLDDLTGRLGWKPFGKTTRGRRHRPASKRPIVRKVFALWGALGRAGKLRSPGRDGLRAFVARRFQVEDPEWLSNEQASAVIEQLKQWEARPTGQPQEEAS